MYTTKYMCVTTKKCRPLSFVLSKKCLRNRKSTFRGLNSTKHGEQQDVTDIQNTFYVFWIFHFYRILKMNSPRNFRTTERNRHSE